MTLHETSGCFPIGEASLDRLKDAAATFRSLALEFETYCKMTDPMKPALGSQSSRLRHDLSILHRCTHPGKLCRFHHGPYSYIVTAAWTAFHETQHSLYALAELLEGARHTGQIWEAVARTSIEASSNLCWLFPESSNSRSRRGATALRSAAWYYRALLHREALGTGSSDDAGPRSADMRASFQGVLIDLKKKNPSARPPDVPHVAASFTDAVLISELKDLNAVTEGPSARAVEAIDEMALDGLSLGSFRDGKHIYSCLSGTSHALLYRYLLWRDCGDRAEELPSLPEAMEHEVQPLFAVIEGLGRRGLERYRWFTAGI